MRTHRLALLALGLSLLAVSCKKKQIIDDPDTKGRAQDIPREIALDNLRKTLPTAETISCTVPKDSWKPSEIRVWVIEPEFVELRFAKGEPVRFGYAEITKTLTMQIGKNSYVAKIYTEAQRDPDREHFTFGWRNAETAKQVTELFDALRVRQ